MAGIQTKEKCDDYEYYKQKKAAGPNYIQKGFKKVWPEDEDLNKKLKCMNDSHSKSLCISEESLVKLEKDLQEYVKSKGDPICLATKKDIIGCIRDNKSIFRCDDQINEFKLCVNEATQNLNTDHLNT